MPLAEFEIAADTAPLPAPVDAFLADARGRIDDYFAERRGGEAPLFVPSDYPAVYRALRALRRQRGEAGRLCEWGSGFGVVAGLAALLGYEAHGIEVDSALVDDSRRLLADHRLGARILHGSFVPEEYAQRERVSDLETRTVLSQADVYADMDLALDDFDVVFAYPGPTEEELFCDLFSRFADYGAALLTYSRREGMRAYRRRTGRRRRSPRSG